MLNIKVAKLVLDNCLSTGADFAEIFYEDTIEGKIQLIKGKVDQSSTSHIFGAGIRILKDAQEVYGYTSDCSLEGLLSLSNDLKASYTFDSLNIEFELVEEDASNTNAVKIDRESKNVNLEEKISYLKIVDDAVKDYSDKIMQRVCSLSDKTQYVTIANTKGKFIHDIRNQQRIALSIVARHEGKSQSSSSTIGGNFDIDTYKTKDLVSFASKSIYLPL